MYVLLPAFCVESAAIDIDNILGPSKPVNTHHASSKVTAASTASRLQQQKAGRSRPVEPYRGANSASMVDYDSYNDSCHMETDDATPTSTDEAHSTNNSVTAASDEPIEVAQAVKDEEKASLSKTKSKMKPLERKSAGSNADGVNYGLMPTMDSNNTVAMMNEINGAANLTANPLSSGFTGGTFSSGASSGVGGASSIDPSLWIRREELADSDASSGGGAASVAEAGKTQSSSEYVHMYWMDASEINGVIYLFGKTIVGDLTSEPKKYVSCCVAVHGIERNLFVLPKVVSHDVGGVPVRAGLPEVHKELQSVLIPHVIPRQTGVAGGLFRCKKVKRKYAFELENVPREESEYLKVVYSAKYGVPSTNVSNGLNLKSIQQIFGVTTTPLELFLMKRKLMGPCWIKVRNPKKVSDAISWCKVECAVENPKFISKYEGADQTPPPLVSMCLSMKTVVNPSTHTHEIVALSGIVHTAIKADEDTAVNLSEMKRFTMVRALGTTCGSNYPHSFPHDIDASLQKQFGNNGIVSTFPNERALLSMFFQKIQQEDPDIFASHNLFGFEFEVIFNRAIANKLPGASWSKIGRLRRQKPPLRGIQDRDATPGRILCDSYKAAKEFLRETTYSLTHLAHSQLNFDRAEVDPIDVPKYFSNSQHIINLVNHTTVDALLVQRLILKLQVIPLTKQLTTVSGNLWSRTARGARAERIEFLLMHEFHALKYILPEKKGFGDDKKNRHAPASDNMDDDDAENTKNVGGHSRKRAKAAYAGGLVLEPKKGLYDTFILLLDFNSLYPSIIQEYDLCFTTVDWPKYMPKATDNLSLTDEKGEDEEEGAASSELAAPLLPPLPPKAAGSFKGVLPRVLKNLVDRRRVVKQLLKKEQDPSKYQQLDIRQKALKLTANSMYGCLGFTFSRFYARPIAALVTSMGRESLQRTVDIAQNQMGLDVIYGDTDSIMINTNLTDLKLVNEIGLKVKGAVNKMYESLELDIDGVFKSMLLLKKKKYAAVTIVEKVVPGTTPGAPNSIEVEYAKEMKGLDLVRRDWCAISKDAGKYVLDQILSGNSKEAIVQSIHEYLTELAADIRENRLDLSRYAITKGLNKNPKDYPDAKNQPHLQVALRMLADNKPVNIGDHIPYIICMPLGEGDEKDNSSSLIAKRAYHPEEVIKSKGELKIDVEWYLSNQILPPISRLCEPIEGTSIAIMSTQLGLDASKYAGRYSNGIDDLLNDNVDNWGFTPASKMDDAERFKDCIPLLVTCDVCHCEFAFTGVNAEANCLNCTHCGAVNLGFG